jgi:hypothetical protein
MVRNSRRIGAAYRTARVVTGSIPNSHVALGFGDRRGKLFHVVIVLDMVQLSVLRRVETLFKATFI